MRPRENRSQHEVTRTPKNRVHQLCSGRILRNREQRDLRVPPQVLRRKLERAARFGDRRADHVGISAQLGRRERKAKPLLSHRVQDGAFVLAYPTNARMRQSRLTLLQASMLAQFSDRSDFLVVRDLRRRKTKDLGVK